MNATDAEHIVPLVIVGLSEILPFFDKFPGNGVVHTLVLLLILFLRGVNKQYATKMGQTKPPPVNPGETHKPKPESKSSPSPSEDTEKIKGLAFPFPKEETET